MVWQVEGDDAEVLGRLCVAQKVPVLAPVGAGRVADDQRDALAGLFVIDAVLDVFDGQIDIGLTTRKW